MRKIDINGETWRYLVSSRRVTVRGPDGYQREWELSEVRADFDEFARGDIDPEWDEKVFDTKVPPLPSKGNPTTGAITPKHIRAFILKLKEQT